MGDPLARREQRTLGELRAALGELDPPVLRAMAVALERDGDRLIGGDWTAGDGEGCLLTLAAHELGRGGGEDLLLDCVAAVRVPALLDEAWAVLLVRTGSTPAARATITRLVAEALTLRPDQATGASSAVSAEAPREALTARAR